MKFNSGPTPARRRRTRPEPFVSLWSRGGVFDSGPKANHKNALHSYCAKYWDDVGSQHMPEMRPF